MDCDVFIAGGGLAGLSLARQLRRAGPALAGCCRRKAPASGAGSGLQGRRIERRNWRALFPAAFSGSRSTCGAATSRNSGSAIFFRTGRTETWRGDSNSARRSFPPVPSFQLDRGRLENWLLDANREAGVEVLDGVAVKDFTFGASHHEIEVDGERRARRSRHAGWSMRAAAPG